MSQRPPSRVQTDINLLNPYAALGGTYARRGENTDGVLKLGVSVNQPQELSDISVSSLLNSNTNNTMQTDRNALADMEQTLTKKEIGGSFQMGEEYDRSKKSDISRAYDKLYKELPVKQQQERIASGKSAYASYNEKNMVHMSYPATQPQPLGFTADDYAYLTLRNQPDCSVILESTLMNLKNGHVERSETGEQLHSILYPSQIVHEEYDEERTEETDLLKLAPSLDMFETPSTSFIRTQNQQPVLTIALHQYASVLVMLQYIATDPYMSEPTHITEHDLPAHPAALLRANRTDVFLNANSRVLPAQKVTDRNDTGVTKNGIWIPQHIKPSSGSTNVLQNSNNNTKLATNHNMSTMNEHTMFNVIMNETKVSPLFYTTSNTPANTNLNFTQPLQTQNISKYALQENITIHTEFKGIRWVHTHQFKQYIQLPLLSSDSPVSRAALTLWDFFYSKQIIWIPIDTCLALQSALTQPLIVRSLFTKEQSSSTSIIESKPERWLKTLHKNSTLAPYLRLSVLSFPVYAYFLASISHTVCHMNEDTESTEEMKNICDSGPLYSLTEAIERLRAAPVMPLEHSSQFHPFSLLPTLTRKCSDMLQLDMQKKKKNIKNTSIMNNMYEECDLQNTMLLQKLNLTFHTHTTYTSKLVNMVHTIYQQHDCNTRHYHYNRKHNTRVQTARNSHSRTNNHTRDSTTSRDNSNHVKHAPLITSNGMQEQYAIFPILEPQIQIISQQRDVKPVTRRSTARSTTAGASSNIPCLVTSTDKSILSTLSRPLTSRGGRGVVTAAIDQPVILETPVSPPSPSRKKATNPVKSQEFQQSFGFAELPSVEVLEHIDIDDNTLVLGDSVALYNEHVRTDVTSQSLPLQTILTSLLPQQNELQEDHYDPSPSLGMLLPSTSTDTQVVPQPKTEPLQQLQQSQTPLQNIHQFKYGMNTTDTNNSPTNNSLEHALYDPEIFSSSYSCLTSLFGTRPGLSYRLKQCLQYIGKSQAKENALSVYRQKYQQMCETRKEVILQYADFKLGLGDHPDVLDLSDDEEVDMYYGEKRELKKKQVIERRKEQRNFAKQLGYSSKTPILNKTTQLLLEEKQRKIPAQSEEWRRGTNNSNTRKYNHNDTTESLDSTSLLMNTELLSTDLWTSGGNQPSLPVVSSINKNNNNNSRRRLPTNALDNTSGMDLDMPSNHNNNKYLQFQDENNLINLAIPPPPLETYEPSEHDCQMQRQPEPQVFEALAAAERAVARDDLLFNTRILLYLCGLTHQEDREWLLRTMHPKNVGNVVTSITLQNAKQELVALPVNQYTEAKTLLEGLIDKNMSDAVAERVQEDLETHPIVLGVIELTRTKNIWNLETQLTDTDTNWDPYNLDEEEETEQFPTNDIFIPMENVPMMQMQDQQDLLLKDLQDIQNNNEYLE